MMHQNPGGLDQNMGDGTYASDSDMTSQGFGNNDANFDNFDPFAIEDLMNYDHVNANSQHFPQTFVQSEDSNNHFQHGSSMAGDNHFQNNNPMAFNNQFQAPTPNMSYGSQGQEEVHPTQGPQQFQQQQYQQHRFENWHHTIGWWVRAEEGDDASFNRQIGWHKVIAPPSFMPHSAGPSSAMTSSAPTPVFGPTVPSYGNNIQVPQLATPQHPMRYQPSAQGPPASIQRPALPQKTMAPQMVPQSPLPRSKARKAAKAPKAKKRSFARSCICPKAPGEKVPPRPKNSFILFRSHFQRKFEKQIAQNGNKVCNQNVSCLAADAWRTADKETKKRFADLAEREKAEHKKKYPNYKYNPGSKNDIRFGNPSCQCGAYQANLEHLRQKGSVVDAEPEPRASKRARTGAPLEAEDEPEFEPDYNPYDFGKAPPAGYDIAPGQQPFEQQPTKRKRSNDSQSERRSARLAGNNVNYTEAQEDEENIIVAQQQQPFSTLSLPGMPRPVRPPPTTTRKSQQHMYKSPPNLAPTAVLTSQPQPQPDSPAMNTRARSSRSSQHQNSPTPPSSGMRYEFSDVVPEDDGYGDNYHMDATMTAYDDPSFALQEAADYAQAQAEYAAPLAMGTRSKKGSKASQKSQNSESGKKGSKSSKSSQQTLMSFGSEMERELAFFGTIGGERVEFDGTEGLNGGRGVIQEEETRSQWRDGRRKSSRLSREE